MSTDKLYIPAKINCGFQKRQGTYTGKLAYIIYFDHTGKLRKETSWQSWRDKGIDPKEFENVPTEGFVLNKGVGGGRCSYSWNHRNEYIRVYDPRDFEFEISVANLLFILRECDCSKGKGLEGKFVYAWHGKELVLLPVISTDYENSQEYTALQAKSVVAKELICGVTYKTKNQVLLTYLGRFDYYFVVTSGYYTAKRKDLKGRNKKYVFWESENDRFVFYDNLKEVATLHSDTVVSNYAELVDKYYRSPFGSKIVNLFIKHQGDSASKDTWVVQNAGGTYDSFSTSFDYQDKTKINYITYTGKTSFIDGVLGHSYAYGDIYKDKTRNYWQRNMSAVWQEPTDQRLYCKLESGSEFLVRSGYIVEKEIEFGD